MYLGLIVENHRFRHLNNLQTKLVNKYTSPVRDQDKVTDRLPFYGRVRPGGTYLDCPMRGTSYLLVQLLPFRGKTPGEYVKVYLVSTGTSSESIQSIKV